MIIQPLLFPKQDVCPEQKMYYRVRDNKVSFETYFNAFSIGKWKKYTDIEDLYFEVESPQELHFTCVHAVGEVTDGHNNTMLMVQNVEPAKHVQVERNTISFTVSHVGNRYKLLFSELPDDGILYVNIRLERAVTDIREAILSGGYGTDSAPTQTPVIALGICTFKREEFLKKNVGLVMNHIIRNPESPLHDKLEVYVSDNGQTIETDFFASDKVHIFPNINAGGAGGFTRCIIEALFYRKPSPFSHIILMDDDILLDTSVLERTWYLLSYIKEEYQHAILGGEMFELDRKYMQYEAGACTKWQKNYFYHRFYDMRKADLVSANEADSPANYSGWWYNCIPTTEIEEDNLPIPAFIHFDDIEYGVRHSEKGLILINGICVWHPQAPNKASVSMSYYDTRNALIAEASTMKNTGSALKLLSFLTLQVGIHVVDYRYNLAECILQGYQDFHKGPEAFMQIEPVSKHAELAAYNYKMISPEEAGFTKPLKLKKNFFPPFVNGIICIFCWLIPPLRDIKAVPALGIEQPHIYKRMYLYDEEKDAGYVLERDYKKAFHYLKEYFKMAANILLHFNQDRKKWHKARKKFTSLAFWENYLHIKAPGKTE